MIEEIIKTTNHVLTNKNKFGDDRCFFEDEVNNILYVFGPSKYVRMGYETKDQTDINCIDFEGGPYIQINDEILANKFATQLEITYDHGIPVVTVNYKITPKNNDKYDESIG